MILVYVSICAVVVGMVFKTIDEDTAGIMDNIDDDEFEQGDILYSNRIWARKEKTTTE